MNVWCYLLIWFLGYFFIWDVNFDSMCVNEKVFMEFCFGGLIMDGMMGVRDSLKRELRVCLMNWSIDIYNYIDFGILVIFYCIYFMIFCFNF